MCEGRGTPRKRLGHRRESCGEVARMKINSPLLEDVLWRAHEGADQYYGSSSMGLAEINDAVSIVQTKLMTRPTSSSARLSTERWAGCSVTVIATGFGRAERFVHEERASCAKSSGTASQGTVSGRPIVGTVIPPEPQMPTCRPSSEEPERKDRLAPGAGR
jgi:cell division GTPase FtsZ